MQSPGLPPGCGRELLLGWLAAVAAANEVRCKGGEYSALQYLYGEQQHSKEGFLLYLLSWAACN